MVARAVSPTSAATSTILAAATMSDFTAAFLWPATNHGSARAELIARDDRPLCCEDSLTHAAQGARHEAHTDPGGADLQLSRTSPQRTDLPGRRCRRARLCIRAAAVRSGDRRNQTGAVSTPGRA